MALPTKPCLFGSVVLSRDGKLFICDAWNGAGSMFGVQTKTVSTLVGPPPPPASVRSLGGEVTDAICNQDTQAPSVTGPPTHSPNPLTIVSISHSCCRPQTSTCGRGR